MPENYLNELQEKVSSLYNRLMMNDFPSNSICSHFGVSIPVQEDMLSMSVHEEYVDEEKKEPKLLVTIYSCGDKIRYSKSEHDSKAFRVKETLNAEFIHSWNGLDNQQGISFVITAPIPLSLSTAINNYHNQKNVFNPSEDEEQGYVNFTNWLEG